MRNNGKATIREVAREAGVSIATVSHVMQGKASLHTTETVQRVRSIAEGLAYSPNRVAQSLSSRRTKTLGLVIESRIAGRFTTNPFCTAVLDGFLECTSEADYQVKIVSLRQDDLEYVANCIGDGSMDAVGLLAPTVDGPLITWARTARIPNVLIGSLPDEVRLSGVDVDDSTTVYEVVCWLIALGHRRIGIITGPPTQWSALRRENAYLRALEEAGLEQDPALRYVGNYEPSSGNAGVTALLMADPPPTAVICGNDSVAIGAIETLHKMHIRVPEDISIVGFDNHEIAKLSRPPLTTIRQPLHEMGMKAAEMLMNAMDHGGVLAPSVVIFPGSLVKRRSVCKPPERSIRGGQ
jgi:LacI family transcriptional regulator